MARNVLLVEDDRNARESLARLLRSMGHEVRAVWNAELARDLLASFHPDVAILDVHLPGMPGDALGLYLRHRFPKVRIILMSGDVQMDRPARLGADDGLLHKPFTAQQLVEALQD